MARHESPRSGPARAGRIGRTSSARRARRSVRLAAPGAQRANIKVPVLAAQIVERGRRRLDDPDDTVRLEIETALARVDALDADIAELDARIEAMIAPFAAAVDRLDEIPGIGPTAAAVILAEAGLDMARFPTAQHLCSWAKFTPRG